MSSNGVQQDAQPVSFISTLASKLPFQVYETQLLEAQWFTKVDQIVLANQGRVKQFASILQEEWKADVSKVQFLQNVKNRFGGIWDDELVGPVSAYFNALRDRAKQYGAEGVESVTASVSAVRQFLQQNLGETWEQDVLAYFDRVIGKPSQHLYVLCVESFQARKMDAEYFAAIIKKDVESVWDEHLKARVTEVYERLNALNPTELKQFVKKRLPVTPAELQQRVLSFLPLEALIAIRNNPRQTVETTWADLLAKSASKVDIVLPPSADEAAQGKGDEEEEAVSLRSLTSLVANRLADRVNVELLSYRTAIVAKLEASKQAMSVEEIKGKFSAQAEELKAKFTDFRAFLDKFKGEDGEQQSEGVSQEAQGEAKQQNRVAVMLRDAVGFAFVGLDKNETAKALLAEFRSSATKAEEFSRRLASDVRDEEKRAAIRRELTERVQGMAQSLKSLFFYATIENFFRGSSEEEEQEVRSNTPVLDDN